MQLRSAMPQVTTATLGPMGIIFVPSTGGVSHAAKEHTSCDDCARGVLLVPPLKQIASLVMVLQSEDITYVEPTRADGCRD